MAISSAERRQSALLDPWSVVLPDGSISLRDRATLVGQYSGVEPSDARHLPSAVLYATLPTNAFVLDIPSTVFEGEPPGLVEELRWFIRGDTPAWAFTFRQGGVPFQLGGWAVRVRASGDAVLFDRAASVIDTASGTAALQLITADGLTAGSYNCQVSMSRSSETILLPSFGVYVLKDLS